MNEKNELVTMDSLSAVLGQSGLSEYANETALAAVTKVSDFLPYIVLQGSSSDAVKKKLCPMGEFTLNTAKDKLVKLGSSFVCLVVAWRPKGMTYKPEVLSFFDSTSKEFQQIQEAADKKDSNCGFGPEFLVWLPKLGKFATYFLANKTGRNEAPNILGPFNEKKFFICEQHSKLIETKKHSWYGPETKKHELKITMPGAAELKAELNKFNKPPASQKEVADDEDKGTRR